MQGSVGATTRPTNRWLQLVVGVICMVMIANLQYGWTLFVKPLNAATGWNVAEIQVAFSLFVALETWLTPIEGWLVDWIGPKNGPRLMVAFGGVFVALGWMANSAASSLGVLYLGACLSGVGGGAIYATCVGNAVKWFPDRRGLAVGLTAAGFGAGAALTVVPIRMVIASSGYAAAFFWFGLVQGAVVFVLAWWMRAPLAGEDARARRHRRRCCRPTEELFAGGDAGDAGFLAALWDVRDRLGKRPDGDRAGRADRQGFQCFHGLPRSCSQGFRR